MHDQTTNPADADEALIERKLTFRNSTYGGLKAFIRAHKRRTGTALTNSAAVDLLLRDRLARELHPSAFAEVLKLSRPAALQALQAIPSGDGENAPGEAPAGRRSDEQATEAPTPARTFGAVTINVNVSRRRDFVRGGV
jgi:hypothetical protein